MEVAFVSACVLLFGPAQEPSKGVAPRRLLPALLLGTLRKLAERGDAGEKLLEPLARACMSVAGGPGSLAPLFVRRALGSPHILSVPACCNGAHMPCGRYMGNAAIYPLHFSPIHYTPDLDKCSSNTV